MEWTILRLLPRAFLLGTAMIGGLSLLVRLLPVSEGVDAAKHIKTVDIFAIASEITLVVAMLTVAFGCFIVHIMKGPAYVCDPYDVEHSDRPKPVPVPVKVRSDHQLRNRRRR